MFIVSDWCGGGWLSISEPLLVSGQVLTPRYLSRLVVDLQNLLACKSTFSDRRMQRNPSKSQCIRFKGYDNSRGQEINNRGYESVVEPVRVCKCHEVVIEAVEWANTGNEESACKVVRVLVKIMGVLAEA